MAGCLREDAALGEIPTGSSLIDIKERATYAAEQARHYTEKGNVSLARSWNNAAQRLRRELVARMKEEGSLGELAALGISAGGKLLIGAAALGAAAYGARQYMQRKSEHAEET